MGAPIGLACLLSAWVTLVIVVAQAIRKRLPKPKPTDERELEQLWLEVDGPEWRKIHNPPAQ
jgi:hypothetical protein